MSGTEDTFQLGIKALIQNSDQNLLLLKVSHEHMKGSDQPPYWDIPGGRIQIGSTAEKTLARELQEETGITTIKSMKPFAMVLSNLRIQHDQDEEDVGLILSAYVCDVENPGTITISDEHTAFGWFSPGEAAALLSVKYPIEFTDKIRDLANPDTGRHTANVGCEAYIVREGKLLLGLRRNVFGDGTWGLPGGHLDFMERADETVIRELQEETGITVSSKNVSLLAVTDDLSPSSNNHYIHLTFEVEIHGQEPKLLEPECCAGWKWFPLDMLPEPLFPPHLKILATIKHKTVYKTK